MTSILSFWLQMSEPIAHMDMDNYMRNDKLSFIVIIAYNII